jgi:hypothetical protein
VPAQSLPRKSKLKKASQEKKQERKAAKTLSLILLVFLITWTPYSVLAVMKGILGQANEVKQDTYVPLLKHTFFTGVHTAVYLGHFVLPLLHKLHNQSILLRPLQRKLPQDLREDTDLQVGLGQETTCQQVLLWLSPGTVLKGLFRLR